VARINRKAMLWLGGAVAALTIGLPVLGQESILPPGFEQPKGAPAPSPAPRPPRGASPSPSPAPAPTPSPSATPPRAAPPSAPASPTIVRDDVTAPDVSLQIPNGSQGGSDEQVTEADSLADVPEEALPPPPPRYDLPPGSRRLLSRVGPLSADTGGIDPSAFGVRGLYATALMEAIERPILSRWAHILLRRTLLSAVDTPATVNGADFTAARANVLLRQGESRAARLLVQQIDIDRASARLRQSVLAAAQANADPAMTCAFAPSMVGQDVRWDLMQAMCRAMDGEGGSASAIIERVTRRRQASAIDAKLAEKVVGAGANSRRNAIVRWENVDELTPWRFGMATTTGLVIPDPLWRNADPVIKLWAVQAPMITPDRRLALAPAAAEAGVLSARSYVDLVALAAEDSETGNGNATAALADDLRSAFVAATLADRVAAVLGLAGDDGNYAGRVLGARAAARIAPAAVTDDQLYGLFAAMFAGGLDNNAMAWAENTRVGSQAWGLLAVGSPRALVGTSASQIRDFASGDSSEDSQRTRLLAAALIGLGRLSEEESSRAASDHSLDLGRATGWSRAIDNAATRGEAGTVVLLTAIGLQGNQGWQGVPPHHLYHITRALRQVGLGAEARMIAAEAVTRG
jgi:hypothetical protein